MSERGTVETYARRYYLANKEKIAKYSSERRRRLYLENRAKVWTLKSNPCVDCGGVFHPFVMDYDHRENKRLIISKMLHLGWPAIEAEIAKCDLVCSNCHRMRTMQRAYST